MKTGGYTLPFPTAHCLEATTFVVWCVHSGFFSCGYRYYPPSWSVFLFLIRIWSHVDPCLLSFLSGNILPMSFPNQYVKIGLVCTGSLLYHSIITPRFYSFSRLDFLFSEEGLWKSLQWILSYVCFFGHIVLRERLVSCVRLDLYCDAWKKICIYFFVLQVAYWHSHIS